MVSYGSGEGLRDVEKLPGAVWRSGWLDMMAVYV